MIMILHSFGSVMVANAPPLLALLGHAAAGLNFRRLGVIPVNNSGATRHSPSLTVHICSALSQSCFWRIELVRSLRKAILLLRKYLLLEFHVRSSVVRHPPALNFGALCERAGCEAMSTAVQRLHSGGIRDRRSVQQKLSCPCRIVIRPVNTFQCFLGRVWQLRS